ncbi:MAG: FRG domain-containing protein [Ancalomicrobiaceae bacterium]|nr:FRG domain-containing protein [Ancalomicrobiaceae bacterium]
MDSLELNKIDDYWAEMIRKYPVDNKNDPNISNLEQFQTIADEIISRAGVFAPLFRGQPDASFELESSLDRSPEPDISMFEYYRRLYVVKPRIEAFTGQRWEEIAEAKDPSSFADYDSIRQRLSTYDVPHYDLLAYLRHCGFPSPLLDWTRSSYISSFFALKSKSYNVHPAIFVFVERPTGMKTSSSREPHIFSLNSAVRTHQRHFLQQAEYTICTQFHSPTGDLSAGAWTFPKYTSAINRFGPSQNIVLKFVLDRTMRDAALKRLHSYNINSYSLFGNEESLIETMAYEEFELNRHR